MCVCVWWWDEELKPKKEASLWERPGGFFSADTEKEALKLKQKVRSLHVTLLYQVGGGLTVGPPAETHRLQIPPTRRTRQVNKMLHCLSFSLLTGILMKQIFSLYLISCEVPSLTRGQPPIQQLHWEMLFFSVGVEERTERKKEGHMKERGEGLGVDQNKQCVQPT